MSIGDGAALIFIYLQCYSLIFTCVYSQGLGNGVELVVPYADRKCKRPEDLSSADREVSPDTNEINLYETYTITCKSGSIFVDSDSVALPSNTVVILTCTPQDDGGAELTPEETKWHTCVSVDTYKEDIQKFIIQITTTPSNYVISGGNAEEVLGCWIQVSDTEFGAQECWSRYDKCASIDIGCIDESGAGLSLVGYNTLTVTETSGKIWGNDIIGDTELKLSLSCVDSDTTICKDVDTQPAKSTAKMSVIQNKRDNSDRDPDLKMNIAEVIDSSDPNLVLYRFQCDEGYSFEDGINDDNVYGYCSKSGGDDVAANEFFVFSTDNRESGLTCYSTCPSNPTDLSAFVSSEDDTAFEQLFMPQMKKEEVFTLGKDGVKCPSGQSLAPGGPDTYNIKCEGAGVSDGANVGKLSCSDEDCPKCLPLCPANPTADDIVEASTNGMKSLTITEGVALQSMALVTKGEVVCEDNKQISTTVAVDHEYSLECTSESDGNGATLYKYSCGDSCPTCYDVCPDTASLADKNVASVQLSGSTNPEMMVTVAASAITCTAGYALSAADQAKDFTLWCGTDGQYSCEEGEAECPHCKGECAANAAYAISDNKVKGINLPKSAPESTVTVVAGTITCDDGFGLPAAEKLASFTLWCGADGSFSCEAVTDQTISCPTCKAVCPASQSFSDRKVTQINFDGTSDPESVIQFNADKVECDADHSVPYLDSEKSDYSVWCGSEGVYLCEQEGESIECPTCYEICDWPADSGSITYGYVNGGVKGDNVLAGTNHVQASCVDTNSALLGPRYISCTDGVASFVGYDAGTQPTCETGVSLCATPIDGSGIVINGGKTGNIREGESFTITCETGKMLDLDTRKNSSDTYLMECEAVEEGVNEDMDTVSCYEGCDSVTTFSGTFSPGPVSSEQAPYTVGQTVTFSCPRGMEVEGTTGRSIERTCTSFGGWNVPMCVEPDSSASYKSVLSWILLIFYFYWIL